MKYVSAPEYSKMSGIGIETIKRKCRNGELKHLMTSGGQYRIAITDDEDTIPKSQYEELLKKYNKLVGVIEFINHATIMEE